MYRTDTDQKLYTEIGGSWGRVKKKKKSKKPQHPNSTVTTCMRQHVYTRAEKQSSILNYFHFLHPLPLSHECWRPLKSEFPGTEDQACLGYAHFGKSQMSAHGNFSGLLEKSCFSSQLYKTEASPTIPQLRIINPPYI